jgi:hypothetical protein
MVLTQVLPSPAHHSNPPLSCPPLKSTAAEWNIIYDKLAKCAESGAKIVLSRYAIGDLATQYFADRDIFCAGRVSGGWVAGRSAMDAEWLRRRVPAHQWCHPQLNRLSTQQCMLTQPLPPACRWPRRTCSAWLRPAAARFRPP